MNDLQIAEMIQISIKLNIELCTEVLSRSTSLSFILTSKVVFDMKAILYQVRKELENDHSILDPKFCFNSIYILYK